MTAITYVGFHLAFVVPALAAVGLAWRRFGRGAWALPLRVGAPVVVFLSVTYTTPWDNLLVAQGVWTYGDGTVLARLWWVPVEEYAFFVLQSVLVTLWVAVLRTCDVGAVSVSHRQRAVGVLAAAAVGAAGLAAVFAGGRTLYLGAILAWAAPVLGVQWAFGWPVLVRARTTMLAGVLVPTGYLSIADRVAIEAGTWTLSPRYTTGVAVLGLPVEEGLFFLVTTLFVVQSLVLLRWVYVAPAVAVPGVVRRFVPLPPALREGTAR